MVVLVVQLLEKQVVTVVPQFLVLILQAVVKAGKPLLAMVALLEHHKVLLVKYQMCQAVVVEEQMLLQQVQVVEMVLVEPVIQTIQS